MVALPENISSGNTAWSGARTVRLADNVDHRQPLDPDHRQIPRICGGAPGNGTLPDDQVDNCDTPEPLTPSARGRLAGTRQCRTRSAQALEVRPPPARPQQTAPPRATRLVYECGKVAGKDAECIKLSIDDLSQHQAVQTKCAELEEKGRRYLRIVSRHGRSIAAKSPIPSGTELCYYI